jgi:DnaJ-class molecular chaperone
MNLHSCCTILHLVGRSIRDRSTSVLRVIAASDESHTAEPLPCAPCRGTGTVISNLGGTAQRVTCPWCEGGGVQIPGHDAQAAQAARAAADAA